MAASTVTNKVVDTDVVQGYIPAYFPEKLSLLQSGILDINTDARFALNNTWRRKGRLYSDAADQEPVAAINLDTNAISSYYLDTVVARRAQVFGNEDLASLAAGESVVDFERDLARIFAHNQALNTEKRLLQTYLPALYNGTGALASTHVVNANDEIFSDALIAEAMALAGEHSNMLTIQIMHSAVYWGSRINLMIQQTPKFANVLEYQQTASKLMGQIDNRLIYINDRLYNSDGVYYTLIGAPGAMFLDVQTSTSLEAERSAKRAGGTTEWVNNYAYAPGVQGIRYAGSAVSAIAGITDAQIATSTNWAKIAGHSWSQTPLVVIKSRAAELAEEV